MDTIKVEADSVDETHRSDANIAIVDTKRTSVEVRPEIECNACAVKAGPNLEDEAQGSHDEPNLELRHPCCCIMDTIKVEADSVDETHHSDADIAIVDTKRTSVEVRPEIECHACAVKAELNLEDGAQGSHDEPNLELRHPCCQQQQNCLVFDFRQQFQHQQGQRQQLLRDVEQAYQTHLQSLKAELQIVLDLQHLKQELQPGDDHEREVPSAVYKFYEDGFIIAVPVGPYAVPGGPNPVPAGPYPVPAGPYPVPGGPNPVPGGPNPQTDEVGVQRRRRSLGRNERRRLRAYYRWQYE